MLTAIIILSLISLLVATEAEPNSSAIQQPAEKPMPPKPKLCFTKSRDSDRMAA
jgi:hypothetical protein